MGSIGDYKLLYFNGFRVYRVIYWDYIGIMENKMETTSLGLRVILRLYWDNGKENANYRNYRGYIGVYRRYMKRQLGLCWVYGIFPLEPSKKC